MKIFSSLIAALLIPGFSTSASAQEKPDFAKLVVGTWEVTKGDKGGPIRVGAVYRFDQDGKMTMTITVAKQVGKMESNYTVKGDQLVIKLSGSTGTGRVITIKKLTDKELIWVEPSGKTAEFKRN